MITPMMGSFSDARPDHMALQKIGWRRQERSETISIAANIYEFACFNDPDTGAASGVKETVIFMWCDPRQRLTVEDAREVVFLAGTGTAGARHFVIRADGYSTDFATALEALAGPGAVVTLIDRSFTDRRKADRTVVHRLAVAEAALMGRPASDVLSWDFTEPEDYEGVADRIAQVLQQVCAAAVDFHGPVDVAGGVERVWGEEGLFPDRRYMLLMALNVVSGAVEGIMPQFEKDPAAIERIREDVARLFDDVRAAFRSEPTP
jgi:hypothetical protein